MPKHRNPGQWAPFTLKELHDRRDRAVQELQLALEVAEDQNQFADVAVLCFNMGRLQSKIAFVKRILEYGARA